LSITTTITSTSHHPPGSIWTTTFLLTEYFVLEYNSHVAIQRKEVTKDGRTVGRTDGRKEGKKGREGREGREGRKEGKAGQGKEGRTRERKEGNEGGKERRRGEWKEGTGTERRN
jgi:hypothetical protein